MGVKVKIISFFCILVFLSFFSTCLFSDDEILSNIISSTSFSQELSNLSPSVEVINAEDIRLLGVENLPELLKIISGTNINRVNGATAEISLRGFSPDLRINPLILLDGMEISEQFYNRNYTYNLSVILDDIDRVEIIKDSSAFSNGYIAPGGIINIVTKHSQFIDKNYITATTGSNSLSKYNFSLNGFNFSTVWKLTGYYRGVNDYKSNRRIDKSKMLNLDIDRYFDNSKIFIKAGISEQDLYFKENYKMLLNNQKMTFLTSENIDNLKVKNFLFNYKYPNIDTSFYYQDTTGFVSVFYKDSFRNKKFIDEFYKFSFRYNYKNLLSGVEFKYYHGFIEDLFSDYSESFSVFFDYHVTILKNITLKVLLRNDTIRNNGSRVNYKFNLDYTSSDKTFNINAGYSKGIKISNMFQKYFDYESLLLKENINFLNTDIPINYHASKHLKPVKIYVSDLSVSKKWNNFLIKTTFFYDRITDIINILGTFKLVKFKPQIDLYSKNLTCFVIHGFDSKIDYKLNKNVKFFASYYFQKIKNKTMNLSGDYFIPEYKISSGLLYSFPFLSGSFTTYYVPSIKSIDNKKSDNLLSFNATVIKQLIKDKIELSLHVENIFNDTHTESFYGKELERMFFVKLKYNF